MSEKFHYHEHAHIIRRKADGYIYVNRGKYTYFVSPKDMSKGDRIKYYMDITKLPSWATHSEYELVAVKVEITEVEDGRTV